MKLLRVCVAIAIAAGVAVMPHIARAQALGEAASLGAGISSGGAAPGSALGSSIGRAMGNEGRRMASSGGTTTSGGVTNYHWSREQLKRSENATRTRAKAKTTTGSKKSQPDFVIFGADSQDQDAEPDATPSQPKAANNKGSSAQSGPKK